jgi:hypothetical protein
MPWALPEEIFLFAGNEHFSFCRIDIQKHETSSQFVMI